MATISESTAREIAANGGCYEDDPPAYSVLRYVQELGRDQNLILGLTQYAVCYTIWEHMVYLKQHALVDVLYRMDE